MKWGANHHNDKIMTVRDNRSQSGLASAFLFKPPPPFSPDSSSLPSVSPHCDPLHLFSPFPLSLATTSSSHCFFSFQPLIAASLLFICCSSPSLLIFLVWFSATVQTRLSACTGNCHVLPLFPFGDHFIGPSPCLHMHAHTHKHTHTQSTPRDPMGMVWQTRLFVGLMHTWTLSPWGHALPTQPSYSD